MDHNANKQLFKEFQPTILKLANNPYFRKELEIAHVPSDKKILRIVPNGVLTEENGKATWRFWTADIFARRLYAIAPSAVRFQKKLEDALWPYDRQNLLLSTFNSGVGDGHLRNANGTWSTCRSATSAGDSVDYTSTTMRLDQGYNGSNYFIGRGRTPFDTSALGAGSATPTSVTMMVNSNSITGTGFIVYLVGIASALASFTSLTANDFDNFNTTLQSDSQFDCTTTGNKTIALNATGIGNINKTGYSDFGLIPDRDYNNNTPGVTTYIIQLDTVESSTSSNRPLLTVALPTSGGAFLLNFM